jgi:hypothetical protein
LSEYDNEETEIQLQTDQELWEAFPTADGIDRADILLQLSMSYCPERAGQSVITMAEMAINIYREAGYTEEEIADFAFCYAEIAEHKSKIADYSGAIEAAKKALPLLQLHKLDNYDQLEWDLLKWLVITGRRVEAKAQLEELITSHEEDSFWKS